MRILLGSATFHPEENGVSTFLQHLAPGLKTRGHEVLIVAPSTCRKDEDRHFKGIRVCGLRSVTLPINRQFRICFSPMLRSLVEKEVREFAPDVIHVQDPFTVDLALVAAARKHHIPIVATHHTDIAMYEEYYRKIVPKPLRGKLADIQWMILCWYFSLMDAVTAPTASAAEPLRDYGLRKPVRVISNGIDVARFRNKKDRSVTRRQFGLPEGNLLLSLGRLDPEKKLKTLLEAVAIARDSVDVRLAVVGKGKMEKALKKCAAELDIQDRVTFVGFVPNAEVPAVYACADVFAITGIAETQGIVTMEAMASGLPVIAANALASPELVQDGVNGYLFEPEDAAQCADRIVKIFSDGTRRHAMGAESLRLIEAHDMENTITAFERLYASLVQGN